MSSYFNSLLLKNRGCTNGLTPANPRDIAGILLKSSIECIITTQPRSQRILNRLQHPLIVTRHHLHELRHHPIPISQHRDRFLTLVIFSVFLDKLTTCHQAKSPKFEVLAPALPPLPQYQP
jgi:hypothetical protein